MAFIVEASSWTSSWAGGTGTRSLRLEALIAWVRAVIARTGRSARPVTSHVIAAIAAVRAGTTNHSTVRTASSPSDTASNGIDTPTSKELIASRFNLEKIRTYLGVNSLAYLSKEGMLKATLSAPTDFCTACFTGRYPIALERGVRSNNTVPSC